MQGVYSNIKIYITMLVSLQDSLCNNINTLFVTSSNTETLKGEIEILCAYYCSYCQSPLSESNIN